MTADPPNGGRVYITNERIYDKLLDVERQSVATQQTMQEVVLPELEKQRGELDTLKDRVGTHRFGAILGGIIAGLSVVTKIAGLW